MKITINEWERDYQTIQSMEIDGKYTCSVGGSEPEDCIIGRDLISCSDIAVYMERAYSAGVNGETFTMEVVEGCPDEN